MKGLKIVLCLMAAFAAIAPCLADTAAVVSEERIVNLPQDQGKWYISVVGNANDAAYLRVLGWFEANAGLKSLKDQVHFCPVKVTDPGYRERYAPTIKGLPTVRLQMPDGVVAYEAAGAEIPSTANSLYSEIATAINGAQADCLRRRNCPNGNIDVSIVVPQADPEPQPIVSVVAGPPVVSKVQPRGLSAAAIVGIVIACAVVGSVAGFVVQWKRTYPRS